MWKDVATGGRARLTYHDQIFSGIFRKWSQESLQPAYSYKKSNECGRSETNL